VTVDEILQRLDGVRREKPGQWVARCPAHDDSTPSLAVTRGEDAKVVLFCQAKCTLDAILRALHLEAKDLFPARTGGDADAAKPTIASEYSYQDEGGRLLFQVVRLVPKSFRQRRPAGSGWEWSLDGVRRVLYRLPELVDPAAQTRTVFVVEGEKDVDSVRQLGFIATCCAGGTNGWKHVAEHAAEVLAGRHVVILPDNDKPGRQYAADVLASLRAVAKSVVVLELPGLAEKGDVSDWIRDGGSARELQRLATEARDRGPATPELVGIDIGTTEQRLAGERERRLADARKLIPYDVAFLDDVIGGMLPGDLVALTARPGAGKTQLASTIAERGARAGRRVLGFFLEANRSEIERRMKYRALAQVYADGLATRAAAAPGTVRQVISFGRWMRGELDELFADIEPNLDRFLAQQIGPRLHTVYRGSSFTLEDTERVMLAMQDRVDLVVVDHLHYVDVEDEQHEVRAQTAIMTKLRDLALRLSKPVLLVVHLKKADGMRPALVPTLGELAGSSNVTRIATHVVALAPAPHNGKDWNLAPTFMAVLKDRNDGAVPLVARVIFDKTTGTYREAYELGRVSRKGNEESWEQIDTLPWWARRALRKDAQEALAL
jgi:hypothetical protein